MAAAAEKLENNRTTVCVEVDVIQTYKLVMQFFVFAINSG